jgi:hypothetical protein
MRCLQSASWKQEAPASRSRRRRRVGRGSSHIQSVGACKHSCNWQDPARETAGLEANLPTVLRYTPRLLALVPIKKPVRERFRERQCLGTLSERCSLIPLRHLQINRQSASGAPEVLHKLSSVSASKFDPGNISPLGEDRHPPCFRRKIRHSCFEENLIHHLL